MFILDTISCGFNANGDPLLVMDSMIPNLISTIINIIKIAVPILLVIFGMLDLGKAVMAQKEDEIKKGQQTFVKRLIAAVIVFLVIFVVQIVIGLVAPRGENADVWSCFDCLINGTTSNNCEPYSE